MPTQHGASIRTNHRASRHPFGGQSKSFPAPATYCFKHTCLFQTSSSETVNICPFNTVSGWLVTPLLSWRRLFEFPLIPEAWSSMWKRNSHSLASKARASLLGSQLFSTHSMPAPVRETGSSALKSHCLGVGGGQVVTMHHGKCFR